MVPVVLCHKNNIIFKRAAILFIGVILAARSYLVVVIYLFIYLFINLLTYLFI